MRTANVAAAVFARDQSLFGAPAGMFVGTLFLTPLSFFTTSTSRLTIGTDDPAEPHLRLHRQRKSRAGRRLQTMLRISGAPQVLHELLAADGSPGEEAARSSGPLVGDAARAEQGAISASMWRRKSSVISPGLHGARPPR
ncbi:hypothetical protein [Streptomyces sp. T028]|uniref:hypothetical protein n=1 Tax=Streptomyces sp. T028 TaxID=3394379 RepID=UPI003A8B5B00